MLQKLGINKFVSARFSRYKSIIKQNFEAIKHGISQAISHKPMACSACVFLARAKVLLLAVSLFAI